VFNGNYQGLKEAVGDQELSQATECPLNYTFENIGINDNFRKFMFVYHMLTFNNHCLPSIQDDSEVEGNNLNTVIVTNNPNKVIVSNELSMSSIPKCTVTLLALFLNSLVSKRATMNLLLYLGCIYGSGSTVLVLGILLPGLVGEQFPITTMGILLLFLLCG